MPPYAPSIDNEVIIISSDEEDLKDELDEDYVLETVPEESHDGGDPPSSLSQRISRIESESSATGDLSSESKPRDKIAREACDALKHGTQSDGGMSLRSSPSLKAEEIQENSNTLHDETITRGAEIAASLSSPLHATQGRDLARTFRQELHPASLTALASLVEPVEDTLLSLSNAAPSSNVGSFYRSKSGHPEIGVQQNRDTFQSHQLSYYDISALATSSSIPAYLKNILRWSPITRATSATLRSDSRSASVNLVAPSLHHAPRGDEDDNHTILHETSTNTAVSPSQLDGHFHDASPTPSEEEVDELVQSAYNSDSGDMEVLSVPSRPFGSPSRRASSSVTLIQRPIAYVIPPDVPWRQPPNNPEATTFLAMDSAISLKPAIASLADVRAGTGIGHLADCDLQQGRLHTISDSDDEESSQGTGVQPPQAQAEDDVARFLEEVSLSPGLAETLRTVGISDDRRMQALGALHWRTLQKLDNTLSQAGVDYVARLLIIDGLKKRASHRQDRGRC